MAATERVRAMSSALPERYAVIPLLGAGTGMRQGELFALALEDVQFLGRDPHISVTRAAEVRRGAALLQPAEAGQDAGDPAGGLSRGSPRGAHAALPARPGDAAVARAARQAAAREAGDGQARADGAEGRRAEPEELQRLSVAPGAGGVRDHARAPRRREAGPGAGGGHARLRHTYASVQLAAGTAPSDVAAWLGDSVAVLLETYAHYMPGNENRARAAVSAFFGRADEQNVPSGREGSALCLVNAIGRLNPCFLPMPLAGARTRPEQGFKGSLRVKVAGRCRATSSVPFYVPLSARRTPDTGGWLNARIIPSGHAGSVTIAPCAAGRSTASALIAAPCLAVPTLPISLPRTRPAPAIAARSAR